MPVQKRVIYNIERSALRHANGKSNKPPLEARVDEEGARARVHARYHLRLADGLDLRAKLSRHGRGSLTRRVDALRATSMASR